MHKPIYPVLLYSVIYVGSLILMNNHQYPVIALMAWFAVISMPIALVIMCVRYYLVKITTTLINKFTKPNV
jgi:hypothetical protein